MQGEYSKLCPLGTYSSNDIPQTTINGGLGGNLAVEGVCNLVNELVPLVEDACVLDAEMESLLLPVTLSPVVLPELAPVAGEEPAEGVPEPPPTRK